MIVSINRNTKLLTAQIGSGGEGTIWLDPDDPSLLVKVYDDDRLPEPGRIEHLVSHPPIPLGEKDFAYWAWPLEVAVDPMTGNVVGFLMRRFEKMVPLGRVWNPTNRISQISRRWLVHAAHSFCMRVYVLHWHNYFRGDINALNDFVDRHARVAGIDMDSVEFRSGDVLYRTPRTRPEFQPPELLENSSNPFERSRHTDVWSLAIVLHMLLRNGEHPFNAVYVGKGKAPSQLDMIREGRWIDDPGHRDFVAPRNVMRFDELPAMLSDLFRRTFQAGHGLPTVRPSVLEFIQCLDEVKRSWSWR